MEFSLPAWRTDQLAKDDVLAAAQRLHDAGPIRVHERLAREAKVEGEFQEWSREHPESIWIWQPLAARVSEDGKTMAVPSQDMAQWTQAHRLLEEFVREKGPELLESPSFRDALALLVARRRMKHDSQGNWPDWIALALVLSRKRTGGGRTADLQKDLLAQAKLKYLDELHALLRRADKETPVGLTQEGEILQYLSAQSFAVYPSEKAVVPLGDKETRRLRQLARHLSAHRAGREKRGQLLDYRRRATKWMTESWHEGGGRGAEREFDNLRKRKERRNKKLRT